MPVTRDDVVQAYRLILGRAPESEAVVQGHVRDHADLDALRRVFLGSDELQEQLARPAEGSAEPPRLPLDAPPLQVETATDPATLARLIGETARFWEAIGETAPHFSVLTAPEFAPDRIAENEARFFASAEYDRNLLLATLARAGRSPEDFTRLVEFGCGVGRMTAYFAPLFREVIGLDISRPHLQLAEATMVRHGIRNARFVQVTAADLHPVESYDLWFSRIVLQHNPPPVIAHILDRMFAGLAPDGVAIFQVPTYQVGYRFAVAEYLRSDLGARMEMHVIPQQAVLELAWRRGCRLVEMREDSAVSASPDWLSNTFVFRKG